MLVSGTAGGQASDIISVAGWRKDCEQAPWTQRIADGENLSHEQAPSRSFSIDPSPTTALIELTVEI